LHGDERAVRFVTLGLNGRSDSVGGVH
jgi:hypothetical protein